MTGNKLWTGKNVISVTAHSAKNNPRQINETAGAWTCIMDQKKEREAQSVEKEKRESL